MPPGFSGTGTMYSQNNNRIITKYSEFLKEQEGITSAFEPPTVDATAGSGTRPTTPTKHVIETTRFYSFEGESDSGRESTPAHTASTVTVTSAEVHNIDSEAESGVDQSSTSMMTLLPPEHFSSSKFSDLFNSSQSHALHQRDLLIHSEDGSFLRDARNDHKVFHSDEVNRPLEVIPENFLHDLDLEGTNDLSAKTLDKSPAKSQRFRVKGERSDGGSLGHYYAGSIASSSLAEAEVTLRRELLSNIRAISKATFFENLYTDHGEAGGSAGSISSDTNNNPNSAAHHQELEALLRLANDSPHHSVVVAESDKDGLLVFEEQKSPKHQKTEDTAKVEDPAPPHVSLDPDKETSITQWILNSQHESDAEPAVDEILPEVTYRSPEYKHEPTMGDIWPEVTYRSPDYEPGEEEDPPQTSPKEEPKQTLPEEEPKDADFHAVSNSINSNSAPNETPLQDVVQLMETAKDSEQFPNQEAPVTKESNAVPVHAHTQEPIDDKTQEEMSDNATAEGSTSSSGESDTGSIGAGQFTPLFSRVHIESDIKDKRDRLPLSHAPGHLTPSTILTLPGALNSVSITVLNPLKQVRYPAVLPKRLSPIYPEDERDSRNRRGFGGNVPGVLRRQNMDQWVAKIVRFYINGDEHLPRFEYRFRPGRDVHNFDGLCDILSERLKLPRGVRHIFTLHGDPIETLDDLRHEHAYVVSSTKKFKALNYGGEVVETGTGEGNGKGTCASSKRRSRSRPPSAPSNRKPPIIRVRRERSLNGVVWGSPHQDWSSGSERNTRPLQQSAVEAEKVLRAAIEESQALAHAPTTVLNKQIIRVINGADPTVQSQVLLNTRVSQEFQELIKDLGLAVKIPRSVQSRMETLTGRAIQSYSQLRSQLKAGNEAFYIYNLSVTSTNSSTRPRGHVDDQEYRQNVPFGSMSKSVSNPTLPIIESSLGKKFPNSIIHLTPGNYGEKSMSNRLTVPLGTKASSSSSLHQSKIEEQRSTTAVMNQNTRLTNSHPNLNLHQRRKSTKKRYEASKYLAHRSRSPSP